MRRSGAHAARISAVLVLGAWGILAADASAQEIRPRPWEAADTLPAADVELRFAEFQRRFDRRFGVHDDDETAARMEAWAERLMARVEERFEDSTILRWYAGAVRLYERLEHVYERTEDLTSWTASGFHLEADVESAAGGTVKVKLEREIRGFDVGLDVRDAVEGRMGLRIGGILRGYHLHLDVADLGQGRLTFGVRKRFD